MKEQKELMKKAMKERMIEDPTKGLRYKQKNRYKVRRQ